MNKPKLYIGLDGPILVPNSVKSSLLGQVAIAEYAKPFMHWAHDHFDVVFLTDRNPGDAFYVSDELGLKKDAVPVLTFELSKAEVLPPHEHFAWVDSELIPGEVTWLGQHKKQDHFFSVDPLTGVTHEHKRMLEGFLNSAKTGK